MSLTSKSYFSGATSAVAGLSTPPTSEPDAEVSSLGSCPGTGIAQGNVAPDLVAIAGGTAVGRYVGEPIFLVDSLLTTPRQSRSTIMTTRPTTRQSVISGSSASVVDSTSLGKRSRSAFESDGALVSRELLRLKDTDEFSGIDRKPVIHTVWRKGKLANTDKVDPGPIVDVVQNKPTAGIDTRPIVYTIWSKGKLVEPSDVASVPTINIIKKSTTGSGMLPVIPTDCRRSKRGEPDAEALRLDLDTTKKSTARVDMRPIVYTVWRNGKLAESDDGAPRPAADIVKKSIIVTKNSSRVEPTAPCAVPGNIPEDSDDSIVPFSPLFRSRVSKNYLDSGLFAGQTQVASLGVGLNLPERRQLLGKPELAEPVTYNRTLPLPMFHGARLLIHGRDFEMPYDIFHPVLRTYPKPPEWRKMTRNRFIGTAKAHWRKAPHRDDFQSKCVCTPADACAESCQNRIMSYECDATNCNVGRDHCTNRAFGNLRERRLLENQYQIGVELVLTADRGYGVRSNRSFRPGQVITEYIGEIITVDECERRMREKYQNNECYYLMSFDQHTIIDATAGSIARFVNHSCKPNCRMVKWIVGGLPRMALFAGDNPIQTGDELTYDYNFDPFSAKNVQRCLCGESNCRGVLGPRSRESKVVKVPTNVNGHVSRPIIDAAWTGKRKYNRTEDRVDDNTNTPDQPKAKKRKYTKKANRGADGEDDGIKAPDQPETKKRKYIKRADRGADGGVAVKSMPDMTKIGKRKYTKKEKSGVEDGGSGKAALDKPQAEKRKYTKRQVHDGADGGTNVTPVQVKAVKRKYTKRQTRDGEGGSASTTTVVLAEVEKRKYTKGQTRDGDGGADGMAPPVSAKVAKRRYTKRQTLDGDAGGDGIAPPVLAKVEKRKYIKKQTRDGASGGDGKAPLVLATVEKRKYTKRQTLDGESGGNGTAPPVLAKVAKRKYTKRQTLDVDGGSAGTTTIVLAKVEKRKYTKRQNLGDGGIGDGISTPVQTKVVQTKVVKRKYTKRQTHDGDGGSGGIGEPNAKKLKTSHVIRIDDKSSEVLEGAGKST